MLAELAQVSVEFEQRVRIFTDGHRTRMEAQATATDELQRFRRCEVSWEEVNAAMVEREKNVKMSKENALETWEKLLILAGRIHAIIVETDLFANIMRTLATAVTMEEVQAILKANRAEFPEEMTVDEQSNRFESERNDTSACQNLCEEAGSARFDTGLIHTVSERPYQSHLIGSELCQNSGTTHQNDQFSFN